MALERHWRILSLTNPFPVALSVTSGFSSCVWLISVSSMHIAAPLCKLTKIVPSYDSIVIDRTLSMVVHSTFTGPFSGGCLSGAFLRSTDFWQGNDILPLWSWLQYLRVSRCCCGYGVPSHLHDILLWTLN